MPGQMMTGTSQRVMTVLACTAVQMLMGSIYAWSVLAGSFERADGLKAWQTQLIFGATITVFASMTLPAGRLLQRTRPRTLAMAGGALFAVGQLVAGAGGADMRLLLLGMSVIAALGIACGYMSSIVACTSAFPKRRGTATGIAVAGFGAGAIVHSRVAEWLLSSGYSAAETMQLSGAAAGLLAIAAAFFIRPPAMTSRDDASMSVGEFLSSPRFRVAAAGMFCGCFGGLLLVGSLRQLGVDAGLSASATLHAISAFAAGNILGRLVWGLMFDRYSFVVIPANLLLAAGAAMLISWCMSSSVGFAVGAGLAGMAFGGNFSLYAAYLAQAFGPDRLARTYPFVFMCYGVAALIGPTVGGALRDVTGSSLAGGVLASAMAIAGAGLVGLLHARAARADRAAADRPAARGVAVRASGRSREMAQVG